MSTLLAVIPCLNEAAHIETVVAYLLRERTACPMRIVIADGGSTDGTVAIAQRLAATHTDVHYLHNPERIQSAAINRAVEAHGEGMDYLLRIDAHAGYPESYASTLLAEAQAKGADAVVVAMRTVGRGGLQDAIAAAQNSRLGNGGSAHRNIPVEGQWVKHGHHALMRLNAFRAVGGYDTRFSHNEDAELDARLGSAGYRIWLTARTMIDYFPRSSLGSLFRQYLNYGRGRARMLRTHQQRPSLRQALPLLVPPAFLLALLTPWHIVFALPLLLWALACLLYGMALAIRNRHARIMLSGPAAMVMHSAWALGFYGSMRRPV